MKMNRKTRAQKDLILADKLVTEVAQKDGSVQKIYGGLCHSFPVLVRTCGLCQALAFSEAKSKAGEDAGRKEAHALLLRHVAGILGMQEAATNESPALEAVRDAGVTEYMLQTRRVLSAWIYFKRFAESRLKVASAQDSQEGER